MATALAIAGSSILWFVLLKFEVLESGPPAWLGWLFVAFVIASLLAVRLTLLANPDEVHARSH